MARLGVGLDTALIGAGVDCDLFPAPAAPAPLFQGYHGRRLRESWGIVSTQAPTMSGGSSSHTTAGRYWSQQIAQMGGARWGHDTDIHAEVVLVLVSMWGRGKPGHV